MIKPTEQRAQSILEVFEGWSQRNDGIKVPREQYLQGVSISIRGMGYSPTFVADVVQRLDALMTERGYFIEN